MQDLEAFVATDALSDLLLTVGEADAHVFKGWRALTQALGLKEVNVLGEGGGWRVGIG